VTNAGDLSVTARSGQRTEHRIGYANGFNLKTLCIRLGPPRLEVSQVRASRSILGVGEGRLKRAS
jgi:hypothetical protein